MVITLKPGIRNNAAMISELQNGQARRLAKSV